MHLCVASWVMVCSCMWVSFDYCRFIELDYTPMEAGIMVSMRQSRGFLTPKSPERHCRSEHHQSIAHSFFTHLVLCPVFFYSQWYSSGINVCSPQYIQTVSDTTQYITDWTACSVLTIWLEVVLSFIFIYILKGAFFLGVFFIVCFLYRINP